MHAHQESPDSLFRSADLSRIPRLGLLAFEGRLPVLLARAAAELRIPVTAVGVQGMTPPEIETLVERMHWLKLGHFNRMIELLHAEGVRHVVWGGRIQHNAIWRYGGFDRRSLKILRRAVNRKADALLGAVVEELASEGIEVIDQALLIRGCMAPAGLLPASRPLTGREQEDVAFGLPLARQIAGLDIGQTIVVKDRAVVAVEGLEGTDAAIRRAGEITGGGNVVVKVAKPRQDARFDVPVVGPTTIRTLCEAGGGALAIEAGATLFLDRDEAMQTARDAGVAVTAV